MLNEELHLEMFLILIFADTVIFDMMLSAAISDNSQVFQKMLQFCEPCVALLHFLYHEALGV